MKTANRNFRANVSKFNDDDTLGLADEQVHADFLAAQIQREYMFWRAQVDEWMEEHLKELDAEEARHNRELAL